MFIGTGPSIIPRTQIGARAVIGAGAAVISDVPVRCSGRGMPCGRQEAFGRQLNAFRSAKRAPSNKPETIALTAKSSEIVRQVVLRRATAVPAFSPLGYVYALGALEQHPRNLLRHSQTVVTVMGLLRCEARD